MINNLGLAFYTNNNFLYIRLIQDINYDTNYVFYKINGIGYQIKYNNDTGKYYLITASIGNAPKGMKIERLPGKDKILNITKNLINPTDILKNKDIINFLDSVRTKYKIMENKMTKKELEALIENKVKSKLNESYIDHDVINNFVSWIDRQSDIISIHDINNKFNDYLKYKAKLNKEKSYKPIKLSSYDITLISKELDKRGMIAENKVKLNEDDKLTIDDLTALDKKYKIDSGLGGIFQIKYIGKKGDKYFYKNISKGWKGEYSFTKDQVIDQIQIYK